MSGTVFVVTSGKGGVGKTTTALNLGVTLRGNDHAVALVDADLGMANLAPMLGVDHETTLHDVLAGEAPLEEAIVEEAEGFGIVPGGRDLAEFAAIDPEELPGVIAALAEEYEYVVVDAGPGLHYESTLPIEAADEVLLVTTPADTAVGDTRKVAELAGIMEGAVRGVVLNRATDEADPEAIAAALDVEVLGVVPEDPAVTESTDAGVPIERYAPDSPAASAYRRLADVLAGGATPSLAAPDVDEGASEESGGGEGEAASAERTPAGTTEAAGGTEASGETTTDTATADVDATDDGSETEKPGEGGDDEDENGGSGLFGRLRGLF